MFWTVFSSFFLGKPWSGLCWIWLQNCPEPRRAWQRLSWQRGAVATLDHFLQGECVLLTSKYHEGLDEKAKTYHRMFGSSSILVLVISSFWFWGKLWSRYCWLVSANKWSRLYENQSNYRYFPVSCSVPGSRLQWMGLFPSSQLCLGVIEFELEKEATSR